MAGDFDNIETQFESIEEEKNYYQNTISDEDENNLNDPSVFTGALRKLAYIARQESDTLLAWEYLQKVLNIDEKNFGPESPIVATDLNDLASVFQELGDMGGAR